MEVIQAVKKEMPAEMPHLSASLLSSTLTADTISIMRLNCPALEVPVVAVGMLEDPALAQSIVGNEDADLIAIARGMLRVPYWAVHAAITLKNEQTNIPHSTKADTKKHSLREYLYAEAVFFVERCSPHSHRKPYFSAKPKLYLPC
ncbi:NADH:flavin oxidoreductase / NADH oxidase family protein [Paenibacillus sp. yr247]|nr:NADH:flavin oxidoreductase / NADH oxidase family protein [Paenibacillus sp. yr247]